MFLHTSLRALKTDNWYVGRLARVDFMRVIEPPLDI